MNAPCKTSRPSISSVTTVCIGSRGSASGTTPCASPIGHANAKSGPDPVLASLSPLRAKEKDLLTSGTYGPIGSTTSESAALQRYLESRLRARLALSGSTLFDLIWKERATPSGFRICALRASARRTSDNDCSSWPTPIVNDATGSQYAYSQGKHDKPVLKLPGAAQMASWPTPRSAEAGPDYSITDRPNSGGPSLQTCAQMASWPTPKASDCSGGRTTETTGGGNAHLDRDVRLTSWSRPASVLASAPIPTNAEAQMSAATAPDPRLEPPSNGTGMKLAGCATPTSRDWEDGACQKADVPTNALLGRQAVLCGPARRTASGAILTGSSAQTASGGQLSPAHSRWLMGLPSSWEQAAPTREKAARKCSVATATPSSRRLRRNL